MAKRSIPDKPTHGCAVPGHPNLQWWGPKCFIRVRITVPADLRKKVGKIDLVKGLGTQCVAEAVRRSHSVIADFQNRIEAARPVPSKWVYRALPPVRPSPDEIEGMGASVESVMGCDRDGQRGPISLTRFYGDTLSADTPIRGEVLGQFEELPITQSVVDIPLAGFTYEAGIAEWIKSMGDAPPAAETVGVYRSHLRRFMRWAKTDDMSRVTEQDIVDYPAVLTAGSDGKKALGNKSVNNNMASIRAVFRVAKAKRKITTDPTVGTIHKMKVRKSVMKDRMGFDRDQHAQIIAQLLTLPHDDPRRWLWLLGEVYGGRISEFADASCSAVRMVHGRLCLDINEEYRNRWQGMEVEIDGEQRNLWKDEPLRIKTDGSMRILPLIPAFDRHGFIKYVETIRAKNGPAAPLFPMIPVNKYGKRSQDASRQCMAWLRKEVGIKDRRLVFHSTRHTVKTFLRGRVEQDVSDAITGHDDGSVSFHYGETELAVMADAIERYIPVA
jgi:integrase